jgi:phage-related tail fiber protein
VRLLPPLNAAPAVGITAFSSPWISWFQRVAVAVSATARTGDAKSSFIAQDSDWLRCDGSAVSRTTYSDLYRQIGTTYGSGDGNTTFNLPSGPASQPFLYIKT